MIGTFLATRPDLEAPWVLKHGGTLGPLVLNRTVAKLYLVITREQQLYPN